MLGLATQKHSQSESNKTENDVKINVELSDCVKQNIPLAWIATVFKRNDASNQSVVQLQDISSTVFDFIFNHSHKDNAYQQIDDETICDILDVAIRYRIKNVWSSCFLFIKNMMHYGVGSWISLVFSICHVLSQNNVELSANFNTQHTVNNLLTKLTDISLNTLTQFQQQLDNDEEYTRMENIYYLLKDDELFPVVVEFLSKGKWKWIFATIWKVIIQCMPTESLQSFEKLCNQMDKMIQVN